MKNNPSAKTLTASLPAKAQEIFTRIGDPENLSGWHSSFCRSLRQENGALFAESPRGSYPIRFIRNDHAFVLDIIVEVADGIELTNAIRVLPTGDGSEIVWTLVKSQGITDSVFHEHLRWAGNALQHLRKDWRGKTANLEVGKGIPVSIETSDSNSQIPTPPLVEAPTSGKKMFIGNLPYNWTDEQLRAHFAEQGTITSAEVARFRGRGGRSRGFGFVVMSTEEEAQTAIQKLHGTDAGGRQMIVRLARSQESRPSSEPVSETAAATPASAAPSDDSMPLEDKIALKKAQALMTSPSKSAPRRNQPRSRRGPSRPQTSRRAPSAHHSPDDQEITNSGGYEIFPRRRA